MTIDGEDHYVGDTKTEVKHILEKYPAAQTDKGLFYYLCFIQNCVWIKQMPPEKQNEVRHFFRDIESLRRRSQEFRSCNK